MEFFLQKRLFKITQIFCIQNIRNIIVAEQIRSTVNL
jgi:hypothetical protein